MEPGKTVKNLRNIGTYLKKSMKFFELKHERLTPVIFSIILFSGFIGTFLPENTSFLAYTIYNTASIIVMYLASSVYLISYIKELKQEECRVADCVRLVGLNAPKIIIASMIYMTAIFAGTLLIIVPGIIVYIMFFFNNCYIVDKGKPILQAFIDSKNLGKGKRLEIFSILILFNVILFLPLFLVVSAAFSSENSLITSFITTFAGVIINLMHQRLSAMIYFDLEYGGKV